MKQADLKLNYGDLKQAVGDEQSAENLQNQVILIRQSKLPDPKEYPNVGSFFKNPVLSQMSFDKIAQQFPNIPHYPQANGSVKVAAGWLIDQTGWKGKQLGSTYKAVQHDVKQKFSISLEPEPVLYDEQGLIQPHGE